MASSDLSLDRRWIYLIVMLAVGISLLAKYSVTPARMKSAERLYEVVEAISRDPGTPRFALVAMDFGPSTKAENEAQTEVIVEHLMRRRVPFIVFTTYALAEVFTRRIPERVRERLEAERPGETWIYGRDWINVGYRPGASLFLQALAKSERISEFLGKDVMGNVVRDMPVFGELQTLRDVGFVGQFTGIVGVLDGYIQFMQSKGYIPPIGHGCTSITIPEAYIYLDSGQLRGVLEGIAGAAWYSEILKRHHAGRSPDSALVVNTALGVAHLVIIGLILLGNVTFLLQRWRRA